jgi:hypothetical protein
MILFKFLVILIVTKCSLSKSNSRVYGLTNLLKPIDAKLQTAISSGEVYSIISVHRFELLMVPKFY